MERKRITQNQKLALVLHTTSLMLDKAIERCCSDINREQGIFLLAIGILSEEGRPTIQEIARFLGYEQVSAFKMVNRLEEKKVVRKIKTSGGSRKSVVALTPKGNAVVEDMRRQDRFLAVIFAGIDKRSLIGILEAIYRNAANEAFSFAIEKKLPI